MPTGGFACRPRLDQGRRRGYAMDAQFWVSVAAPVVAAVGIIVTVILALPKAVWVLSERISAGDSDIREKIDETRKELSAEDKATREKIDEKIEDARKAITDEADKAHSMIGENINRVDDRVDALSKDVGDLRVIVERIDTTLRERAPK